MGLTMHERHSLVRELRSGFQVSGKKGRSAILNNRLCYDSPELLAGRPKLRF
jgi:hypothetical protein